MNNFRKPVLILLALLNTMVLAGQLWPEGAPPFARTINIVTLILNLIFIVFIFTKKVK